MTAEAALALLHRGNPDGALALIESTDATDPGMQAARGTILLARGDALAARSELRAAVALGDTSDATLLNLALAEGRSGDTDRARQLMRSVAVQRPDWDEPWVRLAESFRAAGDNPAAEHAYRHALELKPRRSEALIALAGLLIVRGDGLESRELLLRCCGTDPNRAEAWGALGLALMLTRDFAIALTAFVEAQRLAPGALEYAMQGVNAAVAAEESAAERARLEVAAEADPLNPVIPTALGMLLERMGERDAAIDALETATALAPDARTPAVLLGGVLARSNRLREAESALQRAGELDPDNPQIQNDRAAILMRLHRHAEAHALLTDHIARHGPQVPNLCNLANASACLGLQQQAVGLARQAIALQPDAVLPRRALCNTLPYQDGVTGAALLAALRECGSRLPRFSTPPFANTRDPDRKLVVGLLSGTLKTHPVGWLTIAGFETLDPNRFDLVCLAQSARTDMIGRRFQAAARAWIDVERLNDEALVATARAHGVDILIDLGGYGDAARMVACANRIAPVQVKWVGMQNHSSGLAEMDWFITDRWETPPGFDSLYSERLLRLPDGYVCYSPPPYAPDIVKLPALSNGFVTFGCFNNLAKITPTVIRAWCAILRQVPDARLILKTHQFSDGPTGARILAAFQHEGIDPARVELRGSSGHRAFMNEYNQIDLVLDPFPYSGGLTTCEALWMGVPTITMPGEIFASRHSVSHLSNAGLADWVVTDVDAYIALAVAKAADRDGLAELRAGLRARVKASPLCDAPRFGRNLGLALRHVWREWCEGR